MSLSHRHALSCLSLAALLLLTGTRYLEQSADTELVLGLLNWIISGGGAGALAYVVMNELDLEDWTAERKRYLAFAISAVFGVVASAFLSLLFGNGPMTIQGWVIQLLAAAYTATGVGQFIHGRRDLGK